MRNKKRKKPTKRNSLFVALLSSEATDFDATQLDPETFLINGSAVSNKKKPKLTQIDVNGDGLVDLVIKVDNAKDLFVLGENDAEVIGVANGIPFYGSNVVTR